MTLGEKLRAIDAALDAAGIRHAFGGAIALAYWTLEPRGTRDLDVNVFTTVENAGSALRALPDGVAVTTQARELIARDGQARIYWGDTPVDLFFDYAPIHASAAAHAEHVPFQGVEIPVLGPVELAVFKAMFDRTKDWADIEAMLGAGSVEVDEIRAALEPMIGTGDHRIERLADSARRAAC